MRRLQPPTPTRRAIMQAVGQKDTEPELRLRRALWRAGLRYRVNLRVAGVSPDIAFPGPKVAVYVDGCFWHGCPRHYTAPKHNAGYWAAKLKSNRERDQRHTRRLEQAGWRVLRFWACQVEEELDRVVTKIDGTLKEPQRDR